MLDLAALVALFALVGLCLLLGVMYLSAGWRWDDLRDALLHHAYRSFTHDGEVLPAARPGAAARAVIRLLSDESDARLQLVPERTMSPIRRSRAAETRPTTNPDA